MTLLIITGPANTGKSKLASYLNGDILDSDRIRIPQHGGQMPDHRLSVFPEATEAFDTTGGQLVNRDGVPMSPAELKAVGGPWAWSALRTAEYIVDYCQDSMGSEGQKGFTILTGQFTLDKEVNRKLMVQLQVYQPIWVYLDTPLAICEDRHALSGKNYPVEWLTNYRAQNRPLKEWLTDSTFQTYPEYAFFRTCKQIRLNGALDIMANVTILRDLLALAPIVTPLRLAGPRQNPVFRISSEPKPSQPSSLRCSSDPVRYSKTLPLTPVCLNRLPVGPYRIFPIDTIMTGTRAREQLRLDVLDMNKTRAELDQLYIQAPQGDSAVLTREGWEINQHIHPSLYAVLAQEYNSGNPLICACKSHISDFVALMRSSSTPPLGVTLPIQAQPLAAVILDMADLKCNLYDVPVVHFSRKTGVTSSIPRVFRPFRVLIETMAHIFYALWSLSNDPDDLLCLLSQQIVERVPKGQASSLKNAHFDNIETPWDHGNPQVGTKQYPTLLAVYVVNQDGHYDNLDNSDPKAMGTEIYSHDCSWGADLEQAAASVDLSKSYAPAEGARLLQTYAGENLRLHKGGNGNIMIFNHLHKAVENNTEDEKTRSQWRMMGVQRKSPEGLQGYEKQSENVRLNAMLENSLNSQPRSKCYARYAHYDPRLGGPVVVRNPQTEVQEYGLDQARALKKII